MTLDRDIWYTENFRRGCYRSLPAWILGSADPYSTEYATQNNGRYLNKYNEAPYPFPFGDGRKAPDFPS